MTRFLRVTPVLTHPVQGQGKVKSKSHSREFPRTTVHDKSPPLGEGTFSDFI